MRRRSCCAQRARASTRCARTRSASLAHVPAKAPAARAALAHRRAADRARRAPRLPVRRHRRRVRPLPRSRPRPPRACSRARPPSRSTTRSGRQGLEQKVAQRTESCSVERAARAARKRARDHQQHPAGHRAELDFQAIVDLVGDKLREVFGTGDIGIRWCDETTGHWSTTCTSTSTASGSPAAVAPCSRDGPVSSADVATRDRWSLNTRAEQKPPGSAIAGTDASQVERVRPDHRQRPRAGLHQSSRTTSASTPSAKPKCACCRPSPRAWASRWRTRASSTRRSAC